MRDTELERGGREGGDTELYRGGKGRQCRGRVRERREGEGDTG